VSKARKAEERENPRISDCCLEITIFTQEGETQGTVKGVFGGRKEFGEGGQGGLQEGATVGGKGNQEIRRLESAHLTTLEKGCQEEKTCKTIKKLFFGDGTRMKL